MAHVEYTDSAASTWAGPPKNRTTTVKIPVATNHPTAHHRPDSGLSNQENQFTLRRPLT